MTGIDAFIAANRFGLGPRPGELAAIAKNPKGWVAAQITPPEKTPDLLSTFSSSRERQNAIAKASEDQDRKAGRVRAREIARDQFRPELAAIYNHRITTTSPFRERMVNFWTNHFSVSIGKGFMPTFAAAYPREAIRPYVFSKFSDLLVAAVLHPAMLVYLDNARSVGPNSFVGGRRKRRALNENLGREVLELHTMSVKGGYTQADVIALSKGLTGWSTEYFARWPARREARQIFGNDIIIDAGVSRFYSPLHEPGSKTLLGKTYKDSGPRQAVLMLQDLARHPSTAQFIATKLVRHFVGDAPPESIVAEVARAYKNTDGDLAAVTRTLINIEEVWASPLPKVKTPQDFVVSGLRALGVNDIARPNRVFNPLSQMGQQPFSAPSPEGWPDTAEAWVAPGSLMRRIEWAKASAVRYGAKADPNAIIEETIAPVLSNETRRMVNGAPSGVDAIAFILASREFQRR